MKAMKLTVSLLCFSNDPLKAEVISISKQEQVVIPEAWRAWLHNEIKSDVVYVQDIVHIRVKLKVRLLKPSIVLPMGPHYLASGNHVHLIRMAFGKDQHNLRERDVNHRDSMLLVHYIYLKRFLKHLAHVIMLKSFKMLLIAT